MKSIDLIVGDYYYCTCNYHTTCDKIYKYLGSYNGTAKLQGRSCLQVFSSGAVNDFLVPMKDVSSTEKLIWGIE